MLRIPVPFCAYFSILAYTVVIHYHTFELETLTHKKVDFIEVTHWMLSGTLVQPHIETSLGSLYTFDLGKCPFH